MYSEFVNMLRGKFVADGVLHRNVVTMTAAEVKALRGSPKTLVSAPGAGFFLELESVTLILDYGSEVFAESTDNLVVEYASGLDATAAIETTGFIDQAADQMAHIKGATIATAAAADVANQALRLLNTGDGEFTGNASNDSKLIAIVKYWIHKTNL